MRAAFYRRTGPAADVLEVGQMRDPVPGPGEVLVRLGASGINPADVKRRSGWGGLEMGHPVIVPHCDGAGEIIDVGPDVGRACIGERVWLWNAQGGYGGPGRAFGTAAERIAIPKAQTVGLPPQLNFEQGACLGVPAMTAHRAVFADGPVQGQTMLVQGGGGAVGHFAVQFAALAGARVIATAGTPERAEHAMSAGCERVINRHEEDAVEIVLEITGGDGVDRIIEVDFGANLAGNIKLLKPNGVIAAYSSSSAPTPVLPYYDLAFKGARIHFVQGFNLPRDARRQGVEDLNRHVESGQMTVAVGASFQLEQISQAHSLVEAGKTIGNVVLKL